MKQLSKERQDEYVRIAYYYYIAGFTQEQIAGKMQISRQKVNRILSQCIELGIVEIHIKDYEKSYVEIETELELKYGLKAVRITGMVTVENASILLGQTAAQYLATVIQENDVIGFSRGLAMSSLAGNLSYANCERLTVTQLMGSWNSQQSGITVDDIVHRAAQNMGAATTMLYAPAVVNSKELRNSIMYEPYFKEAYKVIRSCKIAAVGIGRMQPAIYNDIPLMSESEYGLYCDKNAVGEICGHFFDSKGNPVITEFDERTIVISREDYMKIPLRIGVAGGEPLKLPAIRGALKGGYINMLVTDLNTANELLKEES